MYLSIGWSRLMKCDRDIWKIYFACQKCLQNLAIKFSGNLVDFSKCDPYPSQIFDILYFNNYTFVQYKNYCLIRYSRTCFFGIKLSKFQVKVKTVQVVTFVDGIVHLKLFIFELFLHFLVQKIKKYCRTKDGCYAMLHFAARQAPTCTTFQFIFRPPGAQTWVFSFCGISQKGKFFEKFKCCF